MLNFFAALKRKMGRKPAIKGIAALAAPQPNRNIMENILNGLGEMIYITVPATGEILFVNDRLKRHFEIKGETVGRICYEIFQVGMNRRCDFCPCHQLDLEPHNAIVWEGHNILTKRIYHNTDRYIDWYDGNKVHIQYSVDVTELMQTQSSLMQREKMLRTLNKAAIMFLAQHEESFNDMMTAALQLIADELDLGRISVWRNFTKPDDPLLHISQIYRWDGKSGGTTKPTPGLEDVTYAVLAPRWESYLESGISINSPASLLPEAAMLQSFGVVSAFIAPLFINNAFWGFVLFEDREIERFFDDDSADIMRSAAFLCANTVILHEMIQRRQEEGKRLEELVDKRTEELNWQNSLMNTVNAAAAILLEPGTGGDLGAINRSLELVGQSMDADRVYLWQNVTKDDGRLYYKQVCKWMRAEYAMIDDLLEFACEDTLPSWQGRFSAGKSLNGPLDALPANEREFLYPYKLESLLAVPLFLKGELWGFVRFDDCHNHRFFPEADEYTLRSWGLLVVGAIQRGKIMQDLKIAITEAETASAEARNASEAKSRFLANMSHEMRTPMNVVVGLTNLMLEEDEPANIKEILKKLNTAGHTLMGLISNILDISKIEADKLELVPVQYDVASLLNDIITLNMIRTENKPVTFKLDINENMPARLIGDDLRVKQILNNLLSNAFKYTAEGTVTLSVDCRRAEGSEWLSFEISDTGIGIRQEDKARLFTEYNQLDAKVNRKIEGTGLGLSITKKFVELMDGEISVESEYGRGTTFRVVIRQGVSTATPLGGETAKNLSSFRYADKKKRGREKLARPDMSYAKVLAVDDLPANLDVVAGMLRKYKMNVDCVTCGQDAVDRIAAGEPLYDAIFMDHMMPGMDGLEATAAIRALGTNYAKNLPIIALTANAVAGNEQMFLANGFNAFVPKPTNMAILDSIVQRWIRDRDRE